MSRVKFIISEAILFRLGKAIDLAFIVNPDTRDKMGSSKMRRFLSVLDVSSQANSVSSCE
jgi:hypothetical protein